MKFSTVLVGLLAVCSSCHHGPDRSARLSDKYVGTKTARADKLIEEGCSGRNLKFVRLMRSIPDWRRVHRASVCFLCGRK